MLADLIVAEEEGSVLSRERKVRDACHIWVDALAHVDEMKASNSSPALMERANESFIPQLAEAYFLLRLKFADFQITMVQTAEKGLRAGIETENILFLAFDSPRQDY
jgi:hypothetical protein